MNQPESRFERNNEHQTGVFHFISAFSLFGLSVGPNRCRRVPGECLEHNSAEFECDCGGYNEAFIAQHWANYDPIR